MTKMDPALFDVYMQKVHEHLNWAPQPPDRIRFLSLALCGEAGELANLIKKDWRGDGGIDERRQKIVKELADVAGYVFLIAAELGVDLLMETFNKVHEVEQREAFKDYQTRTTT
jgi:NTP pyrophosphatase (non-canonical NTP hydrolase)